MTVADLINEIGKTKKKSGDLYGQYKDLKDQEDVLKAELLFKLKDSGLKSAKGEAYSASIAEKPSIVIKHEQSVLDWLKQAPEIEADAYIGLKTTEFKQFASTLLKKTGEVVPGTDYVVQESLSIKANKGAK